MLLSLFWIAKALSSGFTKAQDVLSTGGLWWIFAIVLGVVTMLALVGLSFLNGWFDDSRNLEPFFWLLGFIIVDVLLIFWLPTALATPKSMRYVPPGSMLLRKIYGG